MQSAKNTATARSGSDIRPMPIPSPSRIVAMLIRREVHDLLGLPSVRLVLFCLWVGLTMASVNDRLDHARAIESHAAMRATYEQNLTGATVDDVAAISHPAIKPPWSLGFLAVGGQRHRPDVDHLVLSAWSRPRLARVDGNEPRGDRRPADWAFLLGAGLSLTAIMLAHDAFCSVRQRLKIKATLAYAVGRVELLAAQFLARWVLMFGTVVGGAITSLAVLAWMDGAFDGVTFARMVLVVGVSGLSMALFLALALLVSMSSRDATRSLGVLAFFWLLWVGAMPTGAELLARLKHPLADEDTVERGMEHIRLAAEAEQGGAGSWRPRAWGAEDDFAAERRAATIQNRRASLQEEARRAQILDQYEQARLARRWALWSPAVLIQESVERLVGSGLRRDRRFLSQAWIFRDHLASVVAAQDRADDSSPHILFFPGYLSTHAVTEIPRFAFRESTIAEGVRHALGPLGLLLGELTLALVASVLLFRRWEII